MPKIQVEGELLAIFKMLTTCSGELLVKAPADVVSLF